MFKDIIVSLAPGEAPDPAADYAVSVASAFGAHLAGVAFVYDPGCVKTPPEVILAL